MPIYVYRASARDGCDYCRHGFEKLQRLSEAKLEICPECEAPVKNEIVAPNLVGQAPSLKEANLEKHGFTQYKKVEKGVYEKTTGKGPATIIDKK